MSILQFHLLPDTAAIDPAGGLTVGGLSLTDLAAEFGTPLFVYDESHLRARCREAVAAFGDGAAYATKAFLCRAMARLAAEEGMRLDVASGGELHTVLSAGVPAQRCVMHGNNKSSDELRMALTAGVGAVVLDCSEEIDRIEALVAEGAPRPRVLIRVTPGIEVHTFEEVQTGQEDSKFGFGWRSGAADDAVARARASSAMELVGLHLHIGSQVFSVDNFDHALEAVAPLVREHGLPELVVGGGLGVAYVEGEEAPTISQWARGILGTCEQAGITARIGAEPGRAVVAGAGLTLYEVGVIKTIPGIRTYVAVDGGMSDNPRPVLYGSGYETFLPRAVAADRTMRIRLVGKHCESGDVLVPEGLVPPDLEVGDVIATPVTGAYGLSLASNYNRVTRPAVVFVADGGARLVVRRETDDDLLATDVG